MLRPNTGPAPNSDQRATVLAPTAVTTGMKLRGRHSNNNSSTASKHRGQRRVECRGHPAGGTRDQQRLAFVGARVQELGEHRANCSAGHDDRALRAERSAAADAHRR